MSEADAETAKLYRPFAWAKRDLGPNSFPSLLKRLRVAGDEARLHLKPTTLKYGQSDEQRIEWFRLEGGDHPIFVYIHGGGWQAGDVASSAMMAKDFATNGIETMVLGYDVFPQVTLKEITQQIETGFRVILDHLRPQTRIYVGGVSAGAHLTSLLLSSIADDRVRGYFLLAGLYDLRPMQKLQPTMFPADVIEEISPMCRPVARSDVYVLITCGTDDSPAFQQQAVDFGTKLRDAGLKNVENRVENDKDHLHMTEMFEDVKDPLIVKLINTMVDNNLSKN